MLQRMQTDLLGKWDYLGILFGGKDSVLFCNLHFVHLRLGGVGYGGVLKEEGGGEAELGRADVQSLKHCRHLFSHQFSYHQNVRHHPLIGFPDHRLSDGR